MQIGIVLGVVLLGLALWALLALTHRRGCRTYAMTRRMPLPYHASQRIEDAQAQLRKCQALLAELQNCERESIERREKLATLAWLVTETRLSLTEIEKRL